MVSHNAACNQITDSSYFSSKFYSTDPSNYEIFDKPAVIAFMRQVSTKFSDLRSVIQNDFYSNLKKYSLSTAFLRLIELDRKLSVREFSYLSDPQETSDLALEKSAICARIIANNSGSQLAAYYLCGIFAESYRVSLPNLDLGDKITPALNRLSCPIWWKRSISQNQRLAISDVSRDLKLVHAKNTPYTSALCVKNFLHRCQNNRSFLESQIAVNSVGKRMSLAEISDKTISNPRILQAETLARVRGYEEYADILGYRCLFITLTLPSRFHRMSKIIIGDRLIKTYPNPRYGGMTPLDGNKYLVNIWAKIQSKFSREKLHPFGLRISEPHHDGTPHWHLSLFAHPDHLDSIENIFNKWCLADSPDEKGAKENRVKIIRIKNGIDPTTGKKFSAVGYMLKYLFKNITGSGLDNSKKCHADWSDQNPLDSSQSITTWVRDNRIRQFQFFGGPSVTVWRELRRLEEQSNFLEKIRLAAASADWSTFIELMGGMNTAREDRPVKPAYGLKKKLNPITGEILEVFQTRYGDESSMQILGIFFQGTTIISRTEIWSIESNSKTLLARQKTMDCVVDTLDELHDQDCKNIAINSNLLRSLAAA